MPRPLCQGGRMGPTDPLPQLTPDEQRVLGSLLEKEVTVPASYPMTLNAVRTACNQSSSREPVTDLDEEQVRRTLRSLKDRDLVAYWTDPGRRTVKHLQTMVARWGLAEDERALLAVLLLRGAQAPGALRTRTERLHPFADREQVEACLSRMAQVVPPLVAQLPRRVREQDRRWVHLLGPVDSGPVEPEPVTDGESVLRDGEQARTDRVLATFAAIAAPYAEALTGELEQLPFERWLLERVIDEAHDGPVVEVGCGPGHVTAWLAEHGADSRGLDLSPAMIEQARERFPGLTFTVGDLRTLMRPEAGDGWAAVLGWFSLIYLAPSELPGAVAALARPLRSGGLLMLALHAGAGVRTADTWFDQPVELEVVLHDSAAVVDVVEAAGLVDVEWFVRGPVAAQDETFPRLYLLARKS